MSESSQSARAGSTVQARLERTQLSLVTAIAAASFISIFAAQLLLGLGLAVYAVRLALGHVRLARLSVDGPILAFAVWTLLSASFAADPLTSFGSAKKLVLFALLYLGVACLDEAENRERMVDAALLGGLVLASWALVQFYLLGFDSLHNRPRSFLGHYMTTAGLCMGVLVLAVARLTFRQRPLRVGRRDLAALGVLAVALCVLGVLEGTGLFVVEGLRLFVAGLSVAAALLGLAHGSWPNRDTGMALAVLAVPICSWALLVSRTRNAWLGSIAGLVLIAILRAPRLLWFLAAALVGVLILRPAPIVERLTITDASSRDRYFMWQAGVDMIRDQPVFGQGPGMILKVYPEYRWPGAPTLLTPHMHNNALQLAAARGLPCLAWWLWLVAAIMAAAYRRAREPGAPDWTATATLAIWTATMVAGVFEYNFGDSEILMFILLISALPFGRPRGASTSTGATAGTVPA